MFCVHLRFINKMTSISLISLLIIACVTIQQTSNAAVDPESEILRTERKKEDLTPNLSSLLKKKPSFLDAGNVKKIDRQDILAKLREKTRTKRWIRTVAKIFKAIWKRLRKPKKVKVTRNGRKITTHYERTGSYEKAVKDFKKLKPYDVKYFVGKNGQVGRVGKIRKNGVEMIVKVRRKSSEGSPTLEVIHGNKVDKYRYKQ